jgi:hypothetical protein
MRRFWVHLALCVCLVIFLTWTKLFQFYDACFVPYLPWDDLPGVFAIVGFDDRPAAMMSIMAAPFEVMKVARRMDFPDDGVTIASLMG